MLISLLGPPTLDTESAEMVESLKQELEFLISDQLQQDLLLFKVIALALSALFIFFILYFLKKDNFDFFTSTAGAEMKERRSYKDYGASGIQKKWNKLKKRMGKKGEAHWKLALIEAEDLFDGILIRMGCGGESIDNRLVKLTEKEISNLADVKRASQVCQDIARDPDYKIDKKRAQEYIDIFEKALSGLNVF